MSIRFILNVILCLMLAALGWWFYLQLSDKSNAFFSSINVASYWFWFLIFFLFSWIFYWFTRKYTSRAWMISLIAAFLISLIATISLRVVTYNHNKQQVELEKKLMKPEGETGDIKNEQYE